jgi:hypothetical protein
VLEAKWFALHNFPDLDDATIGLLAAVGVMVPHAG